MEVAGVTTTFDGFLFDDWFVLEGSTVPRSRMNRPLVEVEISFVLKESLPGPGVNAADVIRATDFVLPSIEIALARGKKTWDKRHAIAERQAKRETEAAVGRRLKGME